MIHAHLVCAAVAGGGLDCAVVVDADRAAVWERVFDGRVTIESELPLGAPLTSSRALDPPPAPGGPRYGAAEPFAAGDFLRCARTTVRAELIGDGGAVWRGAITLPTRGCAHPRVKPRVRCEHGLISHGPLPCDGCLPPGDFENVVTCTVTLDRTPPTPLRLFAREGDAPAYVVDFVGASARVDEPDDDVQATPFAAVHLAITTGDGAIVWRGLGR